MEETMLTLGELRAATAGMEGRLHLAFELDILGKKVRIGVLSARREDDPYLGFDEVVFEMAFDPEVIARDEALMSRLAEYAEILEEYYESLEELE